MAQPGPSGLAGRTPPRPSVPLAMPTSRWSSSQAERDNPRAAPARKVDEKPKKFVLAKPKNVDPLSNLLGYPDFFQLKADEPEEVLSTVNLANGYCEPNFLADEYGSVKDLVVKKLKEQSFKTNLQNTLASISLTRKHFNLRMSNPALTQNKERTTPKRSGESFPRQHAVPQSRAQEFVQHLAGYEPLQKLAASVPLGSKGESLLRLLVEKEVPLLRATWYIKVIYLNMMANDQRKQQAKPSEDWARTLSTFLLKTLLAMMRTMPDWIRKWHYTLRLLNWNYYEGLLDVETLWSALLASLEMPGVEECCQAIVVIQQYIDDLCKSPVHMLRLADACFTRMAKITQPEDPTQARLMSLLTEVLCFIYIVSPQCSAQFLRERIAARVPAAVAALKTPEIEFDPERADVQQLLAELPEGGRYNVFTLLEELEWFPQRGDLDLVARQLRQHASSAAKAADFVQLICEWSVTRHRPSHHRKLLSATLIRKYNVLLAHERMPVDGEDALEAAREQTQARLHVFLDTFDCYANSLEQTELIGLFSELIRTGQFSYDFYLRFLIANDLLSKQDKRARRHFTYLNHFPIVNENLIELVHQQNQRRIALYGVGTKLRSVMDEYVGQTETVKAEIYNVLAELQRDPLNCGPQHASDPRLPMYYLRPLLDSLALHVKERYSATVRQSNSESSLAATWLEPLLHVFHIYHSAGDFAHITHLILWFLQNDIRSLEPLFLALIRENDMAFASLDLLPELLTAVHAKLVQPGIARNLEREFLALLCELCHRYSPVKSVEKWKADADEKMRTAFKSYDPSKERATDFNLGGAPRLVSTVAAPVDLSPQLALLREPPTVARLHTVASQLGPRCTDRDVALQAVREIVRSYLQPFPIQNDTKRRTHVLAYTYLLHDLRAQNASINIDQIFLKHLRDDIVPSLVTTRDSLSEQGRGLLCLLFSCLLRMFVRLDHLLLKVIVPLLSAPQAEDGSQSFFALYTLLYCFSPNFIAPLGVLSQPELDILSRQHHLPLPLIISIVSALVQHGLRIPPPTLPAAGEPPQPHSVELDNDSLAFRALRSVLYNPAVKSVCQTDFARLHDELKRLPHPLDRVLVFNLLGHFAPVRTIGLDPVATPNNESEVSPSPLSSGSPSCNSPHPSPLPFVSAPLTSANAQRLAPAGMTPSLVAWTLREATPLRLHEVWFVLRFALENPLNFVELERPPTALVRLSVTDPTRPALSRAPLVRFLFSELLHRPDAAATYGKLICLLESRDEALSLLSQLLEPEASAPFALPLRSLFLSREKSILEELDLPYVADGASQASEVSSEREEQLHQALLRLALPCIFTASMEQRHSLVLSLFRQLSVFLQLCERFERGQLASRPPTAVAQKHLALRLRLLVPLTPTILKQKNMCKHEELVLNLFRLLGKRLVQAGEADTTVQWFVQLLDALVNGRDFDTAKLAPGSENRLLNRMREELRRMELPPAWRRQIVTALPFLLVSVPSFDYVVPTARLSQPPQVAAEPTGPAGSEAKDVHMDPWRLLEDYNDTPFSLQMFGATRLERVSLTYAQMRSAPGAAPAPEPAAAGQLPKRSAPEAGVGVPTEPAEEGEAVMTEKGANPPQAKAARV